MEIVSVSLDSKKVEEIEELKKEFGIKSRSKIISSAISDYIKRQKTISQLRGNATVIFMITHRHTHKSDVTSVIGGYERLVKTVLHHHSKKGCIDLLIVEGEGANILQIYRKIGKLRGVESIDFSVI